MFALIFSHSHQTAKISAKTRSQASEKRSRRAGRNRAKHPKEGLQGMTDQNIFTFDHLRQIERLKELAGGLDTCKRLGFIHVDEQGIHSLSTAGMGFLLYVIARDVTSLAEAFAAGRAAAFEEIEDQKKPGK
jgi:hypothetical protein